MMIAPSLEKNMKYHLISITLISVFYFFCRDFMGLGYDPVPQKTEKKGEMAMQKIAINEKSKRSGKHYRRYYRTELEYAGLFDPRHQDAFDLDAENKQDKIAASPFLEYDLIRGQSRGLKEGQRSTIENVGMFKGLIQVVPLKAKNKLMSGSKERWNSIDQLFSHVDPSGSTL